MPEPTDRRGWLQAWCAGAVATAFLPLWGAAGTPPFVNALPTGWGASLPPLRLVGDGPVMWLGLHIYDARLWMPQRPVPGDAGQPAPPLALELQYRRALRGPRIAVRSLEEMRRQGELESELAHRWLERMRELFPDVVAGDRLCGVQRADGSTIFLHNERAVGEVADAAFGARFFGIWLSTHSSQPQLRRRLLGLPG